MLRSRVSAEAACETAHKRFRAVARCRATARRNDTADEDTVTWAGAASYASDLRIGREIPGTMNAGPLWSADVVVAVAVEVSGEGRGALDRFSVGHFADQAAGVHVKLNVTRG